ncbi:hypothetical protein GXY_06283 [Novacetimonas hansenii ATCC 23769]|uniref:Uncharacterized protein n=1 Tax=Novacetimonas hansenii ATCC 23769 TaxID=714995 RepID=D5QDP6_NOVHA|nr:hypothetical protein GXY_06283 [Novacetimonas hansenii ATCC 23769]
MWWKNLEIVFFTQRRHKSQQLRGQKHKAIRLMSHAFVT